MGDHAAPGLGSLHVVLVLAGPGDRGIGRRRGLVPCHRFLLPPVAVVTAAVRNPRSEGRVRAIGSAQCALASAIRV
jgi:hypothetical protein